MVINKENFHVSLFFLSFFPAQKSYIFGKSRFAYYTSCSWIYENEYQSQKLEDGKVSSQTRVGQIKKKKKEKIQLNHIILTLDPATLEVYRSFKSKLF